MVPKMKQIKITKLLKKRAKIQHTIVEDDFDDIKEEINQLELQLQERHNEWLQLQRNSQRIKFSVTAPPKEKKPQLFLKPKLLVASNMVESTKWNIELSTLLSGMEVQSFEADDHCTILYHMQHHSEHQVKHGLKIDTKSGENIVSVSSLPLGFNLNAVLESYDSLMHPDCLVAVRLALVAYYNRLQQIESLKRVLKLEADVFNLLDGSHIEIKFVAQNSLEELDEQIEITLMLDYRVFDIRPKQLSYVDLPEGLTEALTEQCAVFKRKPLHKAFREAFMEGIGPYTMVQSYLRSPDTNARRKHKRPRPNPYNVNDDTFQPEDCSSASDDDVQT